MCNIWEYIQSGSCKNSKYNFSGNHNGTVNGITVLTAEVTKPTTVSVYNGNTHILYTKAISDRDSGCVSNNDSCDGCDNEKDSE